MPTKTPRKQAEHQKPIEFYSARFMAPRHHSPAPSPNLPPRSPRQALTPEYAFIHDPRQGFGPYPGWQATPRPGTSMLIFLRHARKARLDLDQCYGWERSMLG